METGSFDQVYQAYFDPVYRYVLSLSADPHTAEEITQEAFFKAMRDASVFPDGGAQASADADMYQKAVEHPEKALYWKLTIAFGRMYEQMQRAWCQYCSDELEALMQSKREKDEENR